MTARREARRVDVTPLREAFVRSGLPAAELCHRPEWYWKGGGADTTRLLRALGLKPYTCRGRHTCARTIGIDRAALIADALNVDPFEVGI